MKEKLKVGNDGFAFDENSTITPSHLLWIEVKDFYVRNSVIRRGVNEIFGELSERYTLSRKGEPTEHIDAFENLFCFIDGNLVKVDDKQEGHSHIVVKFTRSGIPYAVLIV